MSKTPVGAFRAKFGDAPTRATYEEKVKALALLATNVDDWRELAAAMGLLPADWFYQERVVQ